MTQINNLTAFQIRVLDALTCEGGGPNSSAFEWIDDETRQFVRFSDAANWAISNGLTAIGTDDEIINALYALVGLGLVQRKDSRRKSSEWFSLTSEGNLLREALLSDWPTD